MLAYKGFTKDLTCTQGRGIFQYKEGEWAEAANAKCASSGLHCCENPLDCLRYYDFNGGIICIVEAAGDINEDGDHRISCTRLKIIKKLSPLDVAVHAARYMAKHPGRENHRIVEEETGTAKGMPWVIVRGKAPKAAGKKGTHILLLQENRTNKKIKAMAVYRIDGKDFQENTYYNIDGEAVE